MSATTSHPPPRRLQQTTIMVGGRIIRNGVPGNGGNGGQARRVLPPPAQTRIPAMMPPPPPPPPPPLQPRTIVAGRWNAAAAAAANKRKAPTEDVAARQKKQRELTLLQQQQKPPPPPPRLPLPPKKVAPLLRAKVATNKDRRGGVGKARATSSSSATAPPPPPPPAAYVWSEEQCARIRARSYLGPRGYTIWADAFASDDERRAVRALASFQPLAPDPKRPVPPPPVKLAVESDAKWFMPQAQGLALFGVPAKTLTLFRAPPAELVRAPKIRFAQSLYDKQLPILANCITEMHAQYTRQKYAGVIIQAGCGDGKTVMGIFLAVVVAPVIAAGMLHADNASDNASDIASSDTVSRVAVNARRLLFEAEAHAAAEFVDKGAAAGGNKPYLRASSAWPRREVPMPGAVLVLVNKSFLRNQWRQRILAACPGARVGQIQGKKFEVEGCHFVLGMIQTMWSRTYTPAVFAGFQTVIVDEAHCICSFKYFRALRQVVAPFMIALSATVQKPNGMEEVLFRYVGPIVYRAPMVPTKFRVTVRIVQYACHEDPEYSRLDYNKQGDLDYTTTMVRVSNYPPRLDAATDALLRFTQEHPETQILVLSTLKEPLVEIAKRIQAWNRVGRSNISNNSAAANKKRRRDADDADGAPPSSKKKAVVVKKRTREHDDACDVEMPPPPRKKQRAASDDNMDAADAADAADELHDARCLALVEEEEADDDGAVLPDDGRHRPTFGFYVGGMKEAALDESSAQQIILATYSMAAEALDIPTLDGVFMYNSKATITQPLGRSMRVMNDNKFVYDFADAHSVFQGQLYKKRLPVYRGNGYHVYKTTYREMAASPMPIAATATVSNNAVLPLEATSASAAVWRPVFLPPGAARNAANYCGGGGGGGGPANDEDDDGGRCMFGDDDDADE